MSDRPEEQAAEEQLLDLAREGVEPVDPDVAARLAAMRRQAVEIAEASGQQTGWLERLFPRRALAAVAAALSLALAVWLVLRPADETLVLPRLPGFEVALVQELELLEDLEFLAWLEEESGGAG